MNRILVVDDEQDLCEILSFNLESEGFVVQTANCAEEALDILSCSAGQPFDLLLLDVMMERMSGIDLARRLRNDGNQVPIIFLTARGSDVDQLEGFSAGADDYIVKPFVFATVLARIRAVLRRSFSADSATPYLEVGEVCVHVADQRVTIAGAEVVLTNKEFRILCLLMRQAGTFLSREIIMHQAWGDDILVGDRSVDVHIARLRKKLGTAAYHLVNRTGMGYAFV